MQTSSANSIIMVEKGSLKVYEDLLGDSACACRGSVCAHHIDAGISNLTPGKYVIEILMRKFTKRKLKFDKF